MSDWRKWPLDELKRQYEALADSTKRLRKWDGDRFIRDCEVRAAEVALDDIKRAIAEKQARS